MKIYGFFLFALCSLLGGTGFCQIPVLSSSVSSFNSASQGDVYIDENDVYYIGLDDGGLKELGIVTQKGASSDEVLTWNSSSQQWEPTLPKDDDLTISTTDVHSAKRARIRISDNTYSFASGTETLNLSSIDYNQAQVVLSNNVIKGLEGDLRFVVQLNMVTTVQRANYNLSLLVNGTSVQTLFGSLYARNQNNHNETGAQFIFEYEDADTSDEFSFQMEEEANTGSSRVVSTATNTSYVFLDVFKTITALTSVTAPVDNSIPQGPAGPQGPQGPVGPAGATITSPLDVYHAAGSVDSSGTANYIQGATVSKTGTGVYSVSFTNSHPNGSDYAVLISMEQNSGDDDFVPAYTNQTPNGFDVEIGEQDNGTSPGVFIDWGFSFYIPL